MSIKLLVQHLEADLEPALNNMTKVNIDWTLIDYYLIFLFIYLIFIQVSWQNITAVGDQSEYVTIMTTHLKAVVPVVRTYLSTSRKYFTKFCITFAK